MFRSSKTYVPTHLANFPVRHVAQQRRWMPEARALTVDLYWASSKLERAYCSSAPIESEIGRSVDQLPFLLR